MADTLVRPAEQARYRQIALVLVGVLVLAGLGAAAWYHYRPGWRLSWSDDFSGAD